MSSSTRTEAEKASEEAIHNLPLARPSSLANANLRTPQESNAKIAKAKLHDRRNAAPLARTHAGESMESSPEDDLLMMLLSNLRNAIATFGEGAPPVESIRSTIEEHLSEMKRKGLKTRIAATRRGLQRQQEQQHRREAIGIPGRQRPNGSFQVTLRPRQVRDSDMNILEP